MPTFPLQVHEQRLNPDDLKGRHKRRLDKEERMLSVLAGREGREAFGGAAGRKKQKTGGLTEKEKQRKKAMPSAARAWQVRPHMRPHMRANRGVCWQWGRWARARGSVCACVLVWGLWAHALILVSKHVCRAPHASPSFICLRPEASPLTEHRPLLELRR